MLIPRSCFRWAWWCTLLAVTAAAAWAHDPGLSSLTLSARGPGGELVLQFAPQDAGRLVAIDGNSDGRISDPELAQATPALHQLLQTWVKLTDAAARPLAFTPAAPEIDHEGNNVVLRATLTEPLRGVWRLELPRLGELPSGHREFVSAALTAERVVAEALLSRTNPALTIRWPATAPATGGTAGASEPAAAHSRPEPAATLTPALDAPVAEGRPGSSSFVSFLGLGVQHILTGYDHLLYLGGLLILCRRLGSILAIVSSFTVAHSLTLALATLGAVDLPSSIVEPLIAASIVFVGVENLWTRGEEPRWRWMAAFAFGLIHGFGFAGLLRELGVGTSGGGVAVPLLAFNLGVELGQLGIVALVLPLLTWARRRPDFVRWGVPAMSLVVAGAGAWWFVERVWL